VVVSTFCKDKFYNFCDLKFIIKSKSFYHILQCKERNSNPKT